MITRKNSSSERLRGFHQLRIVIRAQPEHPVTEPCKIANWIAPAHREARASRSSLNMSVIAGESRFHWSAGAPPAPSAKREPAFHTDVLSVLRTLCGRGRPRSRQRDEYTPQEDFTRYDQKRELILRTSARIFADKSYHSTSMRDISRQTGVSLAGLYHYCKSKEELLFLIQDHCFGRVLERLEERIKTIDDPFEKLRIFVDNHLSFFAANMAEMKVLSHEAESLAGDLHEHVSTRKRQYTRTARKILSEVQQAAASARRRHEKRSAARAANGRSPVATTRYSV